LPLDSSYNELIALKSEVRTNDNNQQIIVLSGFPVKWKNFRPVAEYYKEKTTTKPKTVSPKKQTFGVDFGIGSLNIKDIYVFDQYLLEFRESYPVFAVGLRYTNNFNPYIGADILKINLNCPFRAVRDRDKMNLQFMTGIRGNTPIFLRTLSGFVVARMGYGLHLSEYELGHGIAFEAEVGLNITRSFFIGFSYNLLSRFVDIYQYAGWHQQYIGSTTLNFNTYSLRIGFNL
jgi:hypothetical protein